MSEHCGDDGKGGCIKHPPTMRLEVYNDPKHGAPHLWYWVIDEACPGKRCSWPAMVDYDVPFATIPAQVETMAKAYYWLLHPQLNAHHRVRHLRRVRAAEKLRAKGKVTPGVTFRG